MWGNPMKGRAAELVALFATILGILLAVFLPFHYEARSLQRDVPPGTQIITLTGVASTGTWTENEVTGSNYWRQSFPAARPVLRVDRPALLRFKSADVVHSFYLPALGVGPVEVEAGHVVELLVTPKVEGVFGYFCPTMCGDPHFGMRGVVIVQGEGHLPNVPATPSAEKYWLEPPPTPGASRVERGRWLLHQKGCETCHGREGRGGVPNWNYVNDTVPALNTLARKMFLFYPEDVDTIVKAMERGISLTSLEDQSPVPRFGTVLAQYESILDVIRRGRIAGKKDPEGSPPPLQMPAWEYRLTDEEINSIICYLLSIQPQDEK